MEEGKMEKILERETKKELIESLEKRIRENLDNAEKGFEKSRRKKDRDNIEWHRGYISALEWVLIVLEIEKPR